ncbi:MAG: hypothetical protein WCK89_14975 [bacterium]
MRAKGSCRAIGAGVALGMLALGQADVYAWTPSAVEAESAAKSGVFGGYLNNATAWLNQKAPAAPDEAALAALLKDPVFATVLARRQLITKTGADKMSAFAKADASNAAFLAWLLGNQKALELYLEAATPTGLAARDENTWTLKPDALEIWKKVYAADPESKDGMYLKMAIGMAINPPPAEGTHSKIAIDPVGRYKYFKAADKNNELVKSFRGLSAWEYSKVFSNNGPTASDEEFTWGREMLRTFRPDFAVDGKTCDIVSMVWRRASPNPYTGMQTMLQGGGKCGPRAFFGVFINQAFGIPSIGVGQPAHACIAFKAADPSAEPQPGSVWKVVYGGGWIVSRCDGLKGPEFVEGVEARMREAQFAQVERLRWLASALTAKGPAAAVLAVAKKIAEQKPASTIDLNATGKAEEAEAEPGTVAASRFGTSKPAVKPKGPVVPVGGGKADQPVKAKAGVIQVEAGDFFATAGKPAWGGLPSVLLLDSCGGGKQIYFQQQMQFQWADYSIDVSAAGTYAITMKAACINTDQLLEVCSGTNVIGKVDIPLSFGLWSETQPVELKLAKGAQTLRLQTPVSVAQENHKRGIALKSFALKAK